MIQLFALVVTDGMLKALPIADVPKDIHEANVLWKGKAKSAEEAEERFMHLFCPKNVVY